MSYGSSSSVLRLSLFSWPFGLQVSLFSGLSFEEALPAQPNDFLPISAEGLPAVNAAGLPAVNVVGLPASGGPFSVNSSCFWPLI